MGGLGGIQLNTLAGNIQPDGTQAAGNSGLAADAKHVHAAAAASGAPIPIDSGTTTLVAGTAFIGASDVSATEANVQMPMSPAITITKASILLPTAPGVGNSWTFTLRKNGVDTNIVITISGTATTGSDTAHSATYALNDTYCWKQVQGGGAAASLFRSTVSA